MRQLSLTKRICIGAVCIALCYILPLAFHAFGAGSALSPMHIPVLLCGLICGGGYGFFCGIVGPILSSVLSGMPPATMLISMIPELCIYGLVTGLLMKFIRTGKVAADLYLCLVPAMLAGRIVGGIAKALFYMGNSESYSLALWAGAYFVESFPGIIAHLIFVPLLVILLTKVGLIPSRYPRKGTVSCE